MSAEATITAVIAHYADLGATVAAVASLAAGTVAPGVLIVVDNQGDIDAAAEDRLRAAAGATIALEVLRPATNIGFAGAGAEGAVRALGAGADWLLIMNNDAEVGRDCLDELLVAGARHPRSGLLGPVIVERDGGQIWFAGGVVDRRTLAVRHETRPRAAAPSPTDFVTGCVLLARVAMVRECGALDASLFMYFEDVEWALRCGGRGWTALVVPSARARHTVARRGSRRVFGAPAIYFMSRNRLLVARSAGRLAGACPTAVSWAARQVAKSESLADVRARSVAATLGLWDGLRGRRGPAPAVVRAAAVHDRLTAAASGSKLAP